jgi:hypothetical protein
MKYLVKNKTTKNIVLLINGSTHFLYPKNNKKGRNQLVVDELTPQLKNIKKLKFIQISKVEKTKEAY